VNIHVVVLMEEVVLYTEGRRVVAALYRLVVAYIDIHILVLEYYVVL
jgi:hypothetical protein